MNIETTKINPINKTSQNKTSSLNNNNSSTNFADELKELDKENNTKKQAETAENKDSSKDVNKALKEINSVVKEFNQSEDKSNVQVKNKDFLTDKNNMINNDFNIQDKDLLPQMNPNMNFSGDGQPFSSFMNNSQNTPEKILEANAQDLAEEAAILSTMTENIAIANRNQMLKETQTVSNEDGIKRVDAKTGIKIENIVKYDSILMNQADVEVFANLIENKEINLNNLTTQEAEKSIHISKTLADMLAKSKESNQPIRINFDNDISVIIRISRDGKITADFLPSSQVAEAYLKENLPLLKQRFDENNIEYDSLNQRERRDNNKEQNRKKDRNNE